jgi:nucleoside 2-deoxyribosyltransferase
MIDIVGGTYHERCFEPYWKETFGSGLRAVFAILSADPTARVTYHTLCDPKTLLYLKSLQNTFPTLKFKVSLINETVEFYYDHPLITPIISPRPDTLQLQVKNLKVTADTVLCYGMIEGRFKITADRVLYDPQSPANPIPFSRTGSKAKKLVVVVNLREAQKICQTDSLKEIKRFFLVKEKAIGLIIKMGPKGAIVFENGKSHEIPVYRTESVWPIGSGDVFSAMVFYKWINGFKLKDAANFASRATAKYVYTKDFEFAGDHLGISPIKMKRVPIDKIYIAGPFFTFTQRWLTNQIRDSLQAMGLNVFSPWHDVGYGSARDVVDLDIKGLNESKVVFAVIDGLDSGTLFEIGYAISKGKKVIAYVQNESKDSIKMLEGTHCIITSDLSTAIYKTFWALAENG